MAKNIANGIKDSENLKNLQFKITAKSYDALSAFSEERGVPMATIIRDAISLYAVIGSYIKEGQKLYLEDPETKEKAQLLVTGLS